VPDVVYDAWWNGLANTADPNIPAFAWANHRRIHQYAGNVDQIHGGIKINIDPDYLDVRFGGGGGGGGSGVAAVVAPVAEVAVVAVAVAPGSIVPGGRTTQRAATGPAAEGGDSRS
jgi:hypothetical protein